MVMWVQPGTSRLDKSLLILIYCRSGNFRVSKFCSIKFLVHLISVVSLGAQLNKPMNVNFGYFIFVAKTNDEKKFDAENFQIYGTGSIEHTYHYNDQPAKFVSRTFWGVSQTICYLWSDIQTFWGGRPRIKVLPNYC